MLLRIDTLSRRFVPVALLLAACAADVCAQPAVDSIWGEPRTQIMSWRPEENVDRVFDETDTASPLFEPLATELPSAPGPVPSYQAAADSPLLADAAESDLQRILGWMAWLTIGLGVAGVAGLALLKWWSTRGASAARQNGSLVLLDSLRLGPRCAVYFVQADAHRLLVGVDQGKSIALQVLPAAFAETLHEELSEEPPAPEPAAAASGRFDRVAEAFAVLQSRGLWPARRSP